jgi:hypothetical protein
MTEGTTIEFLLYCLVGMIGFFGMLITVQLSKIQAGMKNHGERLVRLETRAELIKKELLS